MWRFRTSNPLVALGCGQFALSLTQAMFMFYYVKVYLNVFHVEQFWFNLAQVLFMIWNSINDPLFGYLQDKPGSWLNSRVAVIKYFSPFLVISFVFMWFPWSTTGSFSEGIHLILSLFFYDAFFSALGVAWSALFAETTKEPRLRVSAMKCTQISILFSVNIIAITEKLSHSLENMTNFRIISVAVACLSYLCYCVVGSFKESLPLTNSDDNKSLLSNDSECDLHKENPKQSAWDFAWITTKEVVKERDFIALVACNFIHQIRSVAHMNFASTATEVLISQDILPKGSLRLSLFFGVLTLLPQLLLIANERLVNRYGAYRLMMISYLLSVFSSIFYFSASNAYCNILFMIIDSITVHSVAPFFNIVISDFIDDDAKRNGRRSPISSIVFSLNALFVKPAQSLAPVFAVYFLNNFDYKDYLSSKIVSPSLVEGVAYLSFFTPLVLGSLQFFILRPYSLGNKHIHRVNVM